MLSISKDEIRSIVPMADAILSMRKAFSDFSSGLVIVPDRMSMEIDGKNATVLLMSAYRNKGKYFITKVVTVFQNTISNRSDLISAYVNVFDASTGDMVATLDGDTITSLRTGAASGLATTLLAKKDATVAAIFGTGVQAHTQVEAIISSRPIERVFVYSRDIGSAKKFSKYISETYSVDANPGESDDLSLADIICTATPSTKSLFRHQDLKEGVHINAIGSFKPVMREIPPETIVKAKVVVDSISACKKEAGDLIMAAKEKQWSFDNIYSEIGKIASDKISGRSNDNEVTIFKSVGLGIQDLAISELVLDRLNI